MKNSDSLRQLIESMNTGKKIPAVSLVNSDPDTAAVISKLVKSRDVRRFDTTDSRSFYDLDPGRLTQISDSIKERIGDADNMMQLFPDLELAAQILISSILSPKDMVNVDLVFKTSESILSSELTMKMIEIIRKECEGHYKLQQTLPEILREVLFNSGSYVKAVIPESSVDELINGGSLIATEQLRELITPDEKIVSLGILGRPGVRVEAPKTSIGLESFKVHRLPIQDYDTTRKIEKDPKASLENFYEVTDNFKILKMPKIIETNNRAKIRDIIRPSRLAQEAVSKTPLNDKELEAVLYKGVQGRATPFVNIKTQRLANRKSIGRPLVMRLPSEAVIPVHVPGDEKHHIGYFVLIDEEGNPVSRASARNQMNDLQSRLNESTNSMTSMLLARARRNLNSQDNRKLSIDQAAKIYSGLIEADLIDRLRNGIYGSKVDISQNEEVYRIMMARSFANQFTRLVYIPAELVTYYAYKYYENGVGKSLLDDLKTLISLRGILLFAKVMALTKNSIALTHVNMTLDPNDPDPQKTIEMSIHEIIKMRQQYFPLGINSPVDLVDWIQRAGFEFSFEGHPGIPQTKFDFETKNMQHSVPDSDLDELLRKQTFMALGLSPETVDNGFNAEFATTVVSNNILLSKRVLQIQEQFTPMVSDNIRKIVLNDFSIREQLIDALKENKGAVEKFISDEDRQAFADNPDAFYEVILERFVECLVVDLPKPDITSLENQSEAFTHYSETLDKAIEAWINSQFITSDVSGDIGNNIDTIKEVLKAYFLRRWMAENGFMPELNDMVNTDENGHPSIDVFAMMKDHIEGIMRSSVQFIHSLDPIKKAANQDLENLNVEGGGSPPPEDSGNDEPTGEDDGMGGEPGAGDDLGGGDDLGLDTPEAGGEALPE